MGLDWFGRSFETPMLSKSHTSSTITNWPSLESGLCISWKDSSASGGNWAVRGSVISMIALWHPGNAHWARIVGGLVKLSLFS